MKILLVNDDGIFAPGIRSLQEAFKAAGHEVIMVAPDSERSAASHSLTLRKDITARQIADAEWAIGGTPVDCVVIALQKILKEPVDIVISGINAGQNMGEDVLYSGTVGAAVEASLFGFKAIALSINAYQEQCYESATRLFMEMLEDGIADLARPQEVLNINFPNLPYAEVKGMRLTRTGHRKYYNFIDVKEEYEDGFSFRIGGNTPAWDFEPGTDSEAVNEGYISITPLGFELTREAAWPRVEAWLSQRAPLQKAKNAL